MRRDEDKEAVKRICERLAETRRERGISQQKLSELAGVSRTGLRHIEGLEISPTLYSLLKVSRALGADLHELLKAAMAEDRDRL